MKKKNNLSAYQNFLLNLSLPLFKKIASEGFGTDKCLEKDFLPLPVHFHSPVPNIKDLKKRKIWDKKSELCGINFNCKAQIKLLKKLGKKYRKECQWPAEPITRSAEYFINNLSFSFGCASILHSMIREFKPKNIIEIGSGNSSKIISEALNINKGITNYIIIDPYSLDYIRQKKIKYSRLINKRVELLDPHFFDQLKNNDILFIDSSHSVKIGGDVNFLYLEVFPKLNPGVIVHIHDIALPFEYSETYTTNETFRQFWTEQYLLQGFLMFNKEFEIMLALNYIMTDLPVIFRQSFPYYSHPTIKKIKSGSFWIKRRNEK